MRKSSSLLLVLMLLTTPLAACRSLSNGNSTPAGSTAQSSSLLNKVKERGTLLCGVSGELPGFSYVNQQGKYSGLDVDICRAIAAAIFNNPEAVEFRNLNAKERFAALLSGEVDILSRNTTWTIKRDTSAGLEFAPTVFYDGQAMMVKTASGITDLQDLQNKSICVQTGTTTEQNLADQMSKLGIEYTPLVFEEVNATFAAYEQERCEGVTTDRSQLVSRRSVLPQPDQHIILEAVMSKEPLAPAVKQGDSKWFDTVKWVIYGLIEAEELGINSQNIDQFLSSKDPVVKRFLGTEEDLGEQLGLSKDFMAQAIKKVGNYGEIYDRNLGAKTPFNLERGQNEIWEKGGLMYAPPFR
ncbi:MAG: transporter substrate-binding domain-containing protein [Symploca sp. SIO3C6]|nr:transporter substrate-binding domain-containing protein [Symploca sp. SIO3C6]NET05661.1 transporter substrate-binding domain-containing protein [Symploca sp. SIO2B6]NET52487.1 transporter substrate-binding domain-containing protein [Merismopedia sp. SIO2A8]